MNEERDSQLSAMFDGELPATECELLSRRLGRDELLRARWSRYAAIGAVLRADPTVVVHGNLARRVSAALVAETATATHRHRALWQTVAGAGITAAVAGVAILLLRTGVARQDVALTAFTPSVQRLEAQLPASQPTLRALGPVNLATRTTIAAPSYVVPPAGAASDGGPVPMSAALANYVVAHSEYSSPLSRPHLLSALVASDLAQADAPGPVNTAAGPSGDARH
jgi:sigma-E factor negative regulatory protein RseA